MTKDQIMTLTAGILAGGTGQRLGGVDKGWVGVAGRPLIEHTLDRITDQCSHVIINANRNLPAYRTLGVPVYADLEKDGGPLAGIETILRAATTEYVLIVPVDTPLLPRNLAARLAEVLDPATDIALASSPGGPQHLHALIRKHCLNDLPTARAKGVHSVRDWQSNLSRQHAAFAADTPFTNLNTPGDVAALEKCLESI